MPNIRKLVGKYLGKQKQLGVGAITLTVKTRGTRTTESSGTHPTSTTYTCKGFLERTGKFMDGTFVAEGAAKLTVIGATLPKGIEPKPGTTLTREGVVWTVGRMMTDPVEALYECEVTS